MKVICVKCKCLSPQLLHKSPHFKPCVTFLEQISFIFRNPSVPELELAPSPGQCSRAGFFFFCLSRCPCPGVDVQPGAVSLLPPADQVQLPVSISAHKCKIIRAGRGVLSQTFSTVFIILPLAFTAIKKKPLQKCFDALSPRTQ